jgi:hypothetical protein
LTSRAFLRTKSAGSRPAATDTKRGANSAQDLNLTIIYPFVEKISIRTTTKIASTNWPLTIFYCHNTASNFCNQVQDICISGKPILFKKILGSIRFQNTHFISGKGYSDFMFSECLPQRQIYVSLNVC